MSDNGRDIEACYTKNVDGKEIVPCEEDSQRVGGRGMWSALWESLLALRYLAPAFLIALACQGALRDLLHRLANHVFYPNNCQASHILKWLSGSNGGEAVTTLDEVWRRGWLLCRVVSRALPGACSGHAEEQLSMEHAQSLCEQYLRVEPVFSRPDFQSATLTVQQKTKLVQYLEKVQQAIGRLSPPPAKQTPLRISHEHPAYTLDYVARGMGLCMAQSNRKAYFRIYPTAQQCEGPAEIEITIKGPQGHIGTIVIPPIYSKAQLIRQAFLGSNLEYTKEPLPITQGATYMREFGKTDVKKAFYIPKQDIEVDFNVRRDHAIVMYKTKTDGIHEVTIKSKDNNLIGSPFRVHVSEETIESGSDASSETNEENESQVSDKSERKVMFRIVDFVTEKMILNENGILEKVSDEDAKKLITQNIITGKEAISCDINKEYEVYSPKEDAILHCHHSQSFKEAAKKIMIIAEVCKQFKTGIKNNIDKKLPAKLNFNDIPDIVNSMIFIDKVTSNNVDNPIKQDLLETISTLAIQLKPDPVTKKSENSNIPTDYINVENISCLDDQVIKVFNDNMPYFNEDGALISCSENKTMLVTPILNLSSSNPFLNDNLQDNVNMMDIKNYSSNYNPFIDDFAANEKELLPQSNNYFQIVIEDVDEEQKYSTNPFLDIEKLERPKTPILKIITENIDDRSDYPFIDPHNVQNNSEYINPFFVSKICQNMKGDFPTPKTDFHIGAPVSTSPFCIPNSPVPDMSSIIQAPNLDEALIKYDEKVRNMKEETDTLNHGNIVNITVGQMYKDRLTCDEGNQSEQIEDIVECKNEFINFTPNGIWDSAYVSIDDQIKTQYTNNNQSNEVQDALQSQMSNSHYDYMDKTELETFKRSQCLKKQHETDNNDIDTSCNYFASSPKTVLNTENYSVKPDKNLEVNPPDSMSATLTELNDIYRNYLNSYDSNISNVSPEKEKFDSIEINYSVKYANENDDVCSTSVIESDEKRHKSTLNAASISEVQLNVAESFSVSRSQQDDVLINSIDNLPVWDDQTMFGDSNAHFVRESKKFWDQKIHTLEELKAHEERKWLAFKSKKREQSPFKEMKNANKEIIEKLSEPFHPSMELQAEINLVKKLKQYWDEKLFMQQKLISNHWEQSNNLNSFEVLKRDQHSVISSTNKMVSPSSLTTKTMVSPSSLTTTTMVSPSSLITKTSKLSSSEINKSIIPCNVQKKREIKEEKDKITKERCANPDGNTAKMSPARKNDKIKIFKNDKTIELTKEQIKSTENSIENKTKDIFNSQKKETVSTKVHSTAKVNNITDEQLFEAFENSPKRFFGKSRKNIFGKINTLADNTIKQKKSTTSDVIPACSKTGIVSSRISLFSHVQNGTKIKDDMQPVPTQGFQCIQSEVFAGAVIYKDTNTECEVVNTLKDKKTNIEMEKLDPNEDIMSHKDRYLSEISKNKILHNENISSLGSITNKDKHNKNINSTIEKKSNTLNFVNLETNNKTPANEINKLKKEGIPLDILKRNKIENNTEIINYLNKECKIYNTIHKNMSKSEIDISADNGLTLNELDIYKSCDDLCNVNVKNFIFKFENSTEKLDLMGFNGKIKKNVQNATDSSQNTILKLDRANTGKNLPDQQQSLKNTVGEVSKKTIINSSKNIEDNNCIKPPVRTDTVKNNTEEQASNKPENYKQRFHSAKKFFKSLEELRNSNSKKHSKLNECEMMLYSQESQNSTPNRALTVHSAPTSDCEYEPSLIGDKNEGNGKKLVKISEKFNVNDLFSDIVGDGKIFRRGSFRGIPRKDAVLATFKSMENITTHMNSYEITESQLMAFDKDNNIKNGQTFSTEYPYLPQTEPSKYRSRLDNEAYGLISRKELLKNSFKLRRNSVPNALRLNEKFTAEM